MVTISRMSGEEILDRGMDWAGWQQWWVCLGKGQQGPSALLLDFAFSPVGDVMMSHGYRSLGWVLCEQEGKWESKATPSFLGWKSRARLQPHETYMIFWNERLPVMCEYLHRQHFGRMQGKCCFIQAVDVQIGDWWGDRNFPVDTFLHVCFLRGRACCLTIPVPWAPPAGPHRTPF